MADERKLPRPPPSFEISRQLDHEKIDALERRVEGLQKGNAALRSSVEKNERDTHDLVAYFQRDVDLKDDFIARLNEEVVRKENEFRGELKRQKEEYEAQISGMQLRFTQVETDLRNRLRVADDELLKQEMFRRNREELEQQVQSLSEGLKLKDEESEEALQAQERKFFAEKAKMQRSLQEQAEEFRQRAKLEAQQGLHEDTKRVVNDNIRLKEELRFQTQTTAELQEEKERLEAENRTLRRELSLNQGKEQEFARLGQLKTRQLRQRQEQVDTLEEDLRLANHKLKTQSRRVEETIKKELEASTSDVASLRQVLKLKNKELRRIKKLARTIIEQRNEVEHFFLEALDEVKNRIREERRVGYQQTLTEYNARLREAGATGKGTFPRLPPGRMHYIADRPPSRLPSRPSETVHLQDLTWEDKERVLRLLFARINNVQKQADVLAESGQVPGSRSGNPLDDQPVFTTEGNLGDGTAAMLFRPPLEGGGGGDGMEDGLA